MTIIIVQAILYLVGITWASWYCTSKGYRRGFEDGIRVHRMEFKLKFSPDPTAPANSVKQYVSDN